MSNVIKQFVEAAMLLFVVAVIITGTAKLLAAPLRRVVSNRKAEDICMGRGDDDRGPDTQRDAETSPVAATAKTFRKVFAACRDRVADV